MTSTQNMKSKKKKKRKYIENDTSNNWTKLNLRQNIGEKMRKKKVKINIKIIINLKKMSFFGNLMKTKKTKQRERKMSV